MKLIIKRSEWLRGCDSTLLNNDGKRCCLGILGRELGFKDEELLNRRLPRFTECKWPDWFKPEENGVYASLISTNDAKCISEQEREAKIKELFAMKDIFVEYED